MISHIGGRAPAGIGLVVRAPNGSIVAASQRPRTVLRPGRRPIVLTRSPRGPIREGIALPALALRGPLHGAGDERVRASGRESRFTSRYRFGADRIDVSWRVSARRTDALSAEALFPSWESGDDQREPRRRARW